MIVLGAGIAGVCAALHLRQRGRSVALIDRKKPGQETSYGNAGIIQSEAVEPYSLPRDAATLAAIVLGRSNDVHYRLVALPAHVRSLLLYWRHSAPVRYKRIAVAYAAAIGLAAAEHQVLIERAGCEHLVRRDGYLLLHRTQAAMQAALRTAERLQQEYGVAFQGLSAAELAAAEPVLRQTGAGAIHWPTPWAVRDPGGLVAAYSGLFLEFGRHVRARQCCDTGAKRRHGLAGNDGRRFA